MKGVNELILVTGSNGQLGTELVHLLEEQHQDFIGTTSEDLDITDRAKVLSYIADLRPDIIIHCAAYTAVDQAEDHYELNYKVNVDGTQNVADAVRNIDGTMIYISTDYVFDGTNQSFYQVDDNPNPINAYGRAKRFGEEIVLSTVPKSYVVRTSWVFGKYGNNFVYTMRRLAESHKELTVVGDQIGRPTWTRTLAEFTLFLKKNNQAYGIYHLSNEGICSWYEFAKEILKDNENVEVLNISSEEFPQKAHRPQYSVLDLSKTEKTGFTIPSWQEALDSFLQQLD